MPEPFDRSLRFRPAAGMAVLFFSILAFVIVVVIGLVRLWNLQGDPTDVPQALMQRAPGHLESAPQPALAAYLQEKRQLIERYAWISKDDGLARIPIDVAMRAMVAQAAEAGDRSQP